MFWLSHQFAQVFALPPLKQIIPSIILTFLKSWLAITSTMKMFLQVEISSKLCVTSFHKQQELKNWNLTVLFATPVQGCGFLLRLCCGFFFFSSGSVKLLQTPRLLAGLFFTPLCLLHTVSELHTACTLHTKCTSLTAICKGAWFSEAHL